MASVLAVRVLISISIQLCYVAGVEFRSLESTRVHGVFLVDPEAKPQEIQLSMIWVGRTSPFTTLTGTNVDSEIWTTPRFFDFTLEHDLEYYGVEVEPEDTRILRGVEIWYEIWLHCSFDAEITLQQFHETLNLDYYLAPADHDVVEWWNVSQNHVHGATLDELDAAFFQGNPEHLAARAESMAS